MRCIHSHILYIFLLWGYMELTSLQLDCTVDSPRMGSRAPTTTTVMEILEWNNCTSALVRSLSRATCEKHSLELSMHLLLLVLLIFFLRTHFPMNCMYNFGKWQSMFRMVLSPNQVDTWAVIKMDQFHNMSLSPLLRTTDNDMSFYCIQPI